MQDSQQHRRIEIVRSYEAAPPGVFGCRIFIDVLRASTTLAAIMERGPAEVLCVNDRDVCDEYRGNGYVLFSEVFDGGHGNSPTEALEAELAGKHVVHKSANFSNALFAHAAPDAVLLAGAFVNLRAVAQVARAMESDVLIVTASHFDNGRPALEDDLCAALLAQAIRDPAGDLDAVFAGQAAAVRHELATNPPRLDAGPGSRYRQDVAYALRLDVCRAVPRLVPRDAHSFSVTCLSPGSLS